MDWILDILITYTHHSELQVITALWIISTIHRSSQHQLKLFQTVDPWQRLLTVEILQLPALRFSCHSRPCRNLVNCQLFLAFLAELKCTFNPLLNCYHLFSIIFAGLGFSLNNIGADPTENTAFNISSIVVGVITDPLHKSGGLLILLLHTKACSVLQYFHSYTSALKLLSYNILL
jgi:hypothetical protein